jgi:hypothetical protein
MMSGTSRSFRDWLCQAEPRLDKVGSSHRLCNANPIPIMTLLRACGLLVFGLCPLVPVLAADTPPTAPAANPKPATIVASPLTAEELNTLLGIRSWRLAVAEDVVSIRIEIGYQIGKVQHNWGERTIQRFKHGAEEASFPRPGNEMIIAVRPVESGGYAVSTTESNGPININGKDINLFPGKFTQTIKQGLPEAVKNSDSQSSSEQILEGDTLTVYRVVFEDDQKKELGEFVIRLTFARK